MVAPLGVRVPLFLHVTCRITLMRRDGAGRARELHFRRWGGDRNLCLTVSDILRCTNTSLIVSRLLQLKSTAVRTTSKPEMVPLVQTPRFPVADFQTGTAREARDRLKSTPRRSSSKK